MTTYEQFRRAVVDLPVGSHHTYFRGNLAQAREINPEADKIGRVAYALFELGYVRLYQIRKDAGDLGRIMHYVLVVMEPLKDRIHAGVNHFEGNLQDAELSSDF